MLLHIAPVLVVEPRGENAHPFCAPEPDSRPPWTEGWILNCTVTSSASQNSAAMTFVIAGEVADSM